MALNAIYYPKVKFDSLYIPGILHQIYDEKVYAPIFDGMKDGVAIDCGANCGLVTGYMRQFCKKVYAIEPSPEHFEALSENKKFNEWNNVEIFNLALSDKVGESKFLQSDTNRTANSLIEWIPGGFFTSEVTVKTTDIETFFKKNKIGDVDFLKMDIEAAERFVLKSDAFARVINQIKTMLVEFHQPGWEELVELVHSFGFHSEKQNVDTITFIFRRG